MNLDQTGGPVKVIAPFSEKTLARVIGKECISIRILRGEESVSQDSDTLELVFADGTELIVYGDGAAIAVETD